MDFASIGITVGGQRNSRQNVEQKSQRVSVMSSLAVNMLISPMMPRIVSASASSASTHSSSTLGLPVGGENRVDQPPAKREGDDAGDGVIGEVANELDDAPGGEHRFLV